MKLQPLWLLFVTVAVHANRVVPPKECTTEMFTVVLPTYKTGPFHPTVVWQFDVLHEYICELILVWDLPDEAAVATLKKELEGIRIPVIFDIVNDRPGTLNNRFAPHDDVKTDAILQIDDDIFIRPQGLVAALAAFKKFPDQMLPFATCVHILGGYRYKTLWPLAFSDSCEMGMTNAAMLHKNYHKLYWKETALMELVKHHHNCEDIGMNFVIEKELQRKALESNEERVMGTNIYFYPPTRMWINENHCKQGSVPDGSPLNKGNPESYDEVFDEARLKRWKSGISVNNTGHGGIRDRCIQEFSKLLRISPRKQTPFALSWHHGLLPHPPFPKAKKNPHDYFPGEIQWKHSERIWVDPATGKQVDKIPMIPGIADTPGDDPFITISDNPKYVNLGSAAAALLKQQL